MGLRLALKIVGSRERNLIDLDSSPCPAIMADGVGGVCRRGWQYWLEQRGCSGLQMPANEVPHEGSPVPLYLNIDTRGSHSQTKQKINLDKRPSPVVNAGALSNGNQQCHYWLTSEGEDSYMPDPSKPAYRVPLMSEVAAIPWNGRTVVSTFAGCGGSSLGYRMAGFRVLWANEFIDAAREVYLLNARKGTLVDSRDIRLVTPEDIFRATGLKAGELDVLDGSPPCASFSTAGKRAKHWGQEKKYSDKVQRTDDLFYEFARLLKGLRPKVFVAENVSGLVKGVAKGYFIEILQALKACGYRVEAKLLDAQWLGVPQTRQRIIFVGVREDLAVAPAHPVPLAYRYSVRDAIPWIISAKARDHGFMKESDLSPDKPAPTVPTGPSASYDGHQVERVLHRLEYSHEMVDVTDTPAPSVTAGGKADNSCHWQVEQRVVHDDRRGRPRDITNEPAPTVVAGTHGSGPHQLAVERVVEPDSDISRFAIGREWDKLVPGEQSERYFQLVKAHPERPSPCVTQTGGGSDSFSGLPTTASVCHPTEKRKFSIAELKRICAFPDDFKLTGSYAQQWERLGRAVPPLMMRAIAQVVRDEVLAKIK